MLEKVIKATLKNDLILVQRKIASAISLLWQIEAHDTTYVFDLMDLPLSEQHAPKRSKVL